MSSLHSFPVTASTLMPLQHSGQPQAHMATTFSPAVGSAVAQLCSVRCLLAAMLVPHRSCRRNVACKAQNVFGTSSRTSSRRPVRSRKLHPEQQDPQDLSNYVEFYPALDLTSQHNPTSAMLPAAYTPMSAWPEPADTSPQERLRAEGGYLGSTAEAKLLMQRTASTRERLKLGPNYADDFLRGPDYRCLHARAFAWQHSCQRCLCLWSLALKPLTGL